VDWINDNGKREILELPALTNMIAGCFLVAKLFGLRMLSFHDQVPNVEVGNQRA
jgi:hypothetical protein